MDKSPYDVLGVDKNIKQEDLKSIYRELIQQWHPDKFETDPEDIQGEARKKFDFVQEAYNILKDPEKRRLYDETGYIDPPEGKVRSSVQTMLRTLMNSYLSRGEEIFTIDIIREINNYCKTQIVVCNKNIKDLKTKKSFLVRVIKKFKKKPKLKIDFLSNIFIGEINNIDLSVNGQLESILIFTQVKHVINAYDFDFMKVIEGEELNTPPNRVTLGNIFDLAEEPKSAEDK